MAEIVLYSTSECPKCAALKAELPEEVKIVDMREPEVLAELRCNNVFTMQAPILQVGEEFFTVEDLFKNEMVNVVKLVRILRERDCLD